MDCWFCLLTTFFTIGLLSWFLLFYYFRVVAPVHLYCLDGSGFQLRLTSRMSLLQETYWPTLWAFGQHPQIVAASVMRLFVPDLKYTREVVTLEDGGEVALDWVNNDNVSNDNEDYERPIVLVLPGLTGDPQTAYIKAFVHVAMKEVDALCVVYNYRGMAGLALKTPRMYCATSIEDLEEVLNHVHLRHPRCPILALGISLGGMILGNFLAEKSRAAEQRMLKAAMLVSTVFRPLEGLNNLEKGVLNVLLNNYLTSCLKEAVRRVENAVSDHLDMQQVFSSRTIRELDAAFTAPLHGYEDELAYYAHADLNDRVANITVPTLALNAADDPLQPEDHLPKMAAQRSPNFALIVTKKGSHVGFLEGLWPSNTHFSDRVLQQFLKIVFENHNHQGNDEQTKGNRSDFGAKKAI